jgi:hypothetical protein
MVLANRQRADGCVSHSLSFQGRGESPVSNVLYCCTWRHIRLCYSVETCRYCSLLSPMMSQKDVAGGSTISALERHLNITQVGELLLSYRKDLLSCHLIVNMALQSKKIISKSAFSPHGRERKSGYLPYIRICIKPYIKCSFGLFKFKIENGERRTDA